MKVKFGSPQCVYNIKMIRESWWYTLQLRLNAACMVEPVSQAVRAYMLSRSYTSTSLIKPLTNSLVACAHSDIRIFHSRTGITSHGEGIRVKFNIDLKSCNYYELPEVFSHPSHGTNILFNSLTASLFLFLFFYPVPPNEICLYHARRSRS